VYMPIFLMGVLLNQQRNKEFTISIIFSILLLVYNNHTLQAKNTYLVEFLSSSLFFLLINSIHFNFKTPSQKIITAISQASYSIFLFNYT
jgi:hypothetical protein